MSSMAHAGGAGGSMMAAGGAGDSMVAVGEVGGSVVAAGEVGGSMVAAGEGGAASAASTSAVAPTLPVAPVVAGVSMNMTPPVPSVVTSLVSSARGAGWRNGASLLVMMASGFAGLGYQIVWTQQSAVWLGHESAAVLAVITAFFGGLALGSFAFGPRIEKSTHPARWYAGCEIVIALWGVTLALVLPTFSSWMLTLTGAQPGALWQWMVAFCGTFMLLLPATAAMGATLPAMERVTVHLREGERSIAALYASNTLGAVIGVLAAAFWMIPGLGLVATAGVCIALNLLCGVASLALCKRSADAPAATATAARATATTAAAAAARAAATTAAAAAARATAAAAAATAATTAPASVIEPGSRAGPDVSSTGRGGCGARGVLVCLAATGLLGIGYEVVVVRVLSQVSENTVYTFATLLAVYLVGTAAGAAAYKRWVGKGADSADVQDRLISLLAIACLVSAACLWGAEWISPQSPGGSDIGNGSERAGGSEAAASGVAARTSASMVEAVAGEGVLALLAFGLPTLVMGALFSHLCSRARGFGVTFGRALAVNTLGATTAPLVFGVLVLPTFGAKAALLIIGIGYLALMQPSQWRSPFAWAPACAAIAIAVTAPPLIFVDVPDGGRIVSYREGVMGAVSVVEDAQGVLRLRIDNRQQEGSTATLRVDGRQGLLPVFLHPAPKHALFLGLGTGVTSSTAAQAPTLTVEAVELLPEVIAASPLFTHAVFGDTPNPRLSTIAADARRYVRASRKRYDVIVSDNFHPARSGSGSLYTVEHFAAVRERLASDGVFCQWLPLHQLDLQTLRSIVRSFLQVYPHGSAMLASSSLETPVIGLVGRADDGTFNMEMLRARLAGSELSDLRSAIGIEDELALLGSFIAGPQALKRFAGSAPLNTDDLPIVAYIAPRITYAPDSSPRDRLFALLAETNIRPTELIGPSHEPEAARLAAYWKARDAFIESGKDIRPSADVRSMLAQAREPLLAALRLSPDFRPAYDPLLRMAAALARSDPPAARALLAELIQIQPARPEAEVELRRLQ